MSKTIVLARDQADFEVFKRNQFKPDDFYYVPDTHSIMLHHKVEVLLLPRWLENKEYLKGSNIKQLISKVRKP